MPSTSARISDRHSLAYCILRNVKGAQFIALIANPVVVVVHIKQPENGVRGSHVERNILICITIQTTCEYGHQAICSRFDFIMTSFLRIPGAPEVVADAFVQAMVEQHDLRAPVPSPRQHVGLRAGETIGPHRIKFGVRIRV